MGGIIPVETVLRGKEAKKTKGLIGGKTTQRRWKCSTTRH